MIWEFQKKNGQPIEELKVSTYEGKPLRVELLILLKDIAGLKYSEIIEIPPFDTLKLPSLGKLYRDAQTCKEKEELPHQEELKK